MKPTTQAMKDLRLAARSVEAVVNAADKDVPKYYKRLSRSFPVLVRTAGLGQALAFCAEKRAGGGARAAAYGFLLDHVNETLGTPDTLAYLCKSETSTSDYIRATRRVLAAWVFFKRFAVASIEGEEDE